MKDINSFDNVRDGSNQMSNNVEHANLVQQCDACGHSVRLPDSVGNYWDDAQVLAQVTNSVRLANEMMTDLIGGVQKCLELALELSQSENPLSGEIVGSMNQIVGNVKQVSNELERISSVAVVGSSQSLDMMMVSIQKRVARIVVEKFCSNDTSCS